MKKPRDEHYQDFLAFHRANPHIWRLLVQFAREVKAAGVTRTSIALLVERVRWEVQVVTKSTDGYRINNNFRAFYSRKFGKLEEFKDLFATRRQTSRKTVSRGVPSKSARRL